MASSDEEGEILPNCVTDYHFLDHEDKLVSFAALPLQWRQSENVAQLEKENHVFLLATVAHDGLQKVHKKVVSWKFDLSFMQPEVSVLSKDMNWITLQKPRKSFECTVRTVLVTLQWLQFVKKNPGTTGRDLWNHLFKAFSTFEVEPSGKDLFDHMPLISEAFERDKDLAKCKNPVMLMARENSNSNEVVQTTKKSKFIVEMDEDEDDRSDGNFSDGDDGLYDPVCALCDNGGEILCCQGRCMRSFHATINAGGGYCESLGFQDSKVEAIPAFVCPNCEYKQHQCFVCGNLGSSDNSDHPEVFPCISASCGHFYHPKCVAKVLEPTDTTQVEELEDRIAAGESFTCPVHRCCVCKQGEDKQVSESQFAICRRCPKAYHRKCLPRTISFEKNYAENISRRAWEDLLPNRILIYCTDHEFVRELETPARDHIKFPDVEGQKLPDAKGQQKLHSFGFHSRKKRMQVSCNATVNFTKPVEKGTYGFKTYDSTQNIGKRCSEPSFRAVPNVAKGIRTSSMENLESASLRFSPKREDEFPMQSHSSISLKMNPGKSKENLTCGVVRKATKESVIKKAKRPSPSAQADMENRILALIKESTSSFNHEEFMKRQKLPATYELFSANSLENTITTEKVDGSVKAIQKALKKLDEGCSIDEAKAICDPELLDQVFHWKRKLSIYLAPFLHGMRYTSYGRHFTKLDKLQEVVNRLHCYVENGDTIVDFCCGSNDFSVLMKEKLENTGKQCYFKNYDLIMPKNDFCFEQRDWMSVNPVELPVGSQLIMGLNPPFGVKASIANRFIDKALHFQPKLLILIVPEETKRVDQKRIPYDLIWEDKLVLSGKSFYLPGSVDAENKQLEDWNLKAPPLYLWSRRDWTIRHRQIAIQHYHVLLAPYITEGNNSRNYLTEENHDSPGPQESGDTLSVLEDLVYDESGEDEPEEPGAGRAKKLGHGNWDDCFPSDMCFDIELSSPAHSPTCFEALREAFGSPETEEPKQACQCKLNRPVHGHLGDDSNTNPEIRYSPRTLTAGNGSGGCRM